MCTGQISKNANINGFQMLSSKFQLGVDITGPPILIHQLQMMLHGLLFLKPLLFHYTKYPTG